MKIASVFGPLAEFTFELTRLFRTVVAIADRRDEDLSEYVDESQSGAAYVYRDAARRLREMGRAMSRESRICMDVVPAGSGSPTPGKPL